MKHFCDDWIQDWCEANGWTELFIERYNNYWAFPPGAVMPEPIPPKTLRIIKAEKGFCQDEKKWLYAIALVTSLTIILSYIMRSPMPLVCAFAFDAIAAAKLEVEDF